MLTLHPPTFSDRPEGIVRVACDLTGPTDRQIWFEVPKEFETLLDRVSADAFALVAALQAMQEQQLLHVAAPMSERLFLALGYGASEILVRVVPGLQPCRITAEDLLQGCDAPVAAGVGTGFSGGVDSFCVLRDHFASAGIPAGRRVTHLLYNNVGANGLEADIAVWRRSYEQLTPAAAAMGLPFVPVNSNLTGFVTVPFCYSHTIRNLAAAMLLAGGLGRYLYASGLPYVDSLVAPADVITVCEPALIPLLSTERLQLIPSGSEYTRTEKTRLIAEMPETRRFLDVCVWGERDGNCSTCYKCLRTLTTLEALGVLNEFDAVFDLERYRGIRAYWLASLLASRSAIERELAEYVRSVAMPIPFRSRCGALLLRLVGPAFVQRLKRLVRRRHPLQATQASSAN